MICSRINRYPKSYRVCTGKNALFLWPVQAIARSFGDVIPFKIMLFILLLLIYLV